jgi:hypothetical protein
MSLLNLFREQRIIDKEQAIQPAAPLRAFDLGRIGNTEISMWLEINEIDQEKVLTVKIKNEGNKPVKDLTLSVRHSSQIVIKNRGEVFGTEKNKAIIKNLPLRKLLVYSTEIHILKDLNPARIKVSISKSGKGKLLQTLTTSLQIPPKLS